MAHDHDHAHEGFDVTVERTGPCVATIRFTVSPEEFQKSRQKGLQNYARQTRMKGFRPGKVPAHVIERKFGDDVDKMVVEYFVQHAFEHAVKDEGLKPATSPRIDYQTIESSRSESWGHEFEVLLRPDVELGQIEGLPIETYKIEVGDEELENALKGIRREMSHPEAAGDEGLPTDGMAVCKVEFFREGKDDEPVLDQSGMRLNPKTPMRTVDEAKWEEAMTGAKEGETREFSVEFPEDFPDPESRGKKGTCRISLDEVYKVVPPEDEVVYQQFGVEDEDALREEVRKRMLDAKTQQEEQRVEQVLLENLLEAHPLPLPEPVVMEQADSKVAELREALESQGMDPTELEARLAEEHKTAFDNAAKAMRAIYLMEEIAQQKELKLENADFVAEFAAIAERNGVPIEDVRKYYQEERLLQQLAMELMERKVRRFLRENADITEVGAPD